MTDEVLNGGAIREIATLVNSKRSIDVAKGTSPDGVEYQIGVVNKGDGKFEIFDVSGHIDKFRNAPRFRKGVAHAYTAQSFIDLVNRHADENSAIFADIASDAPGLTAVIDYHQKSDSLEQPLAPRFCQHKIVYSFPLSEEWRAWMGLNGKEMPQEAFAKWVEDHIAEIASAEESEKPIEAMMQTKFGAPVDLMKLSRGLTINVDHKVANVVNLQSGEGQIVFEETHKDSDGKPLKVPGLFVVSIPLFIGGANVRLVARLRYRKVGGSIAWSFVFYRWREAFRAALEADVKTVADQTNLPVYEGAPEA
jgi:uncharacterized protein YfdQ (DUF2303 family)